MERPSLLFPLLLLMLWIPAVQIASGEWTPTIKGCYLPAERIVSVAIRPPKRNTNDYSVYITNFHDPDDYYENSRRHSISETEVTYNIPNVPAKESVYNISVIPRGSHGELLYRYILTGPCSVHVPTDHCHTTTRADQRCGDHTTTTTTTTTAAETTATKSTTMSRLENVRRKNSVTENDKMGVRLFKTGQTLSSLALTVASSASSSSSSSSTTTSKTTILSSVVVQIPKIMGTITVDGSTDDSHHHHSGIRHGKWLIIIVAAIAVLFLVFIAAMVYAGRGCRARHNRRLSFRTRTSEEGGTMSETVPQDPEMAMVPIKTEQFAEQHQHQHQQNHQARESRSFLPEVDQDKVFLQS